MTLPPQKKKFLLRPWVGVCGGMSGKPLCLRGC